MTCEIDNKPCQFTGCNATFCSKKQAHFSTTIDDSKIIKAIKEIRRREDAHHQKKVWCNEHGMKLDAILHDHTENELRRVCSFLEDMFDTGFIS